MQISLFRKTIPPAILFFRGRQHNTKKRNDGEAKPANTAANEPVSPKTTWLTVGVKLILGVGMVSTLCMGALLYAGWQTSLDVHDRTQALLALNATLNEDLRGRISTLQEKYLEIPAMLTVDPAADIEAYINDTYTVHKAEVLKGRDAYSGYFKRRERRDVTKGRFVVLVKEGRLIAARGLLDNKGEFTDQVKLIHLGGADPEAQAPALREAIQEKAAAAESADALEKKISQLNSRLADEALAAEDSRTRILYNLDRIKAGEADLEGFKDDRQRTTLIISGITICLNLLVLYAMTWIHVEGPLKRLTRVIRKINEGEDVDVPFQARKDKIGVLARVLASFKGALQDLMAADLRKAREQQMIQDLIRTMTDLIEDLQTRSQSMKRASFDLHELAGTTSDQTDAAATAIARTDESTSGVADAAGALQTAVADIHAQVKRQNDLVTDIRGATRLSMENITDLDTASKEIGEIIKIVKKIASQTRLLALNARIEASRAGAAGKGFAVVANEVRDLSMQTESANQEIEDKISAIQNASNRMNESTKGVEALIQTLSGTGKRIYAAVKDQRSLSEGIAQSAAGTSADARDLSTHLSAVKEAAQETRRLSDRVRTHSSGMESALDELLAGTREKLVRISSQANTSLTIC